MIGLMANSGIKGSQSGTALRTMFTKLIDGATLTSDNFGEVTVATQNTDGTMRTLSETVSDLRKYFNQMTDAEKLMNAESLVGKYAMSGFVSLMNSSEDDFESLSAVINDCSGAAQGMADIKMDNLTGSLALMSSAWDAVKTSIGEQFIPTAREGVDVIADILTGVNDFINANPNVVKGIGAAAAIIGTVTVAVTGFAAAAKVAAVAAGLFTGTVGALAGPILAVTAGIAALTAAVIMSEEETENLTAEAEEHQRTLEELNERYEEAVELYGEGSDEAEKFRQGIEDFNAAIADTPQTVEEAVSQYETLIESIQATDDAYREAMGNIESESQASKADASQLADMGTYYPKNNTGDRSDTLDNVIENFNTQYPELNLTREEVVSDDTSWQDRLNGYIEEEEQQEKVNEAWSRRGELLEEQEKLQEQFNAKQKQLDAAKRKQATAKENLDAIQAQDVFLDQKAAAEYDQASAEVETLRNEFIDLGGVLTYNSVELENVNEILGMTEEQLQAAAEAEAYAASDAGQLEAATQDLKSGLSALSEQYDEALAAAKESVEGQFELWDKAPTVVATSISKLQQASQSRETYWETYADDLEYLIALSPEVDGLGEVLQKLGDGSEDSANTVAGLAAAARNGSGDLQAYIDQLTEEQDAMDRVEEVMAEANINWPSELQNLTDTWGDTVDGLDLSEESSKNARETLQALIDEAYSYAEPVKKAYQDVGRSMIAGINAAIAANPIQVPTVTVSTPSVTTGGGSTDGYASGTDNAPPGWAWVGEEGPELMRFSGGETVLSTATSQQFAQNSERLVQALQSSGSSGSGLSIGDISIQIATTDSGESLEDYVSSSAFSDRIVEVIRDAAEDAARRAW